MASAPTQVSKTNGAVAQEVVAAKDAELAAGRLEPAF